MNFGRGIIEEDSSDDSSDDHWLDDDDDDDEEKDHDEDDEFDVDDDMTLRLCNGVLLRTLLPASKRLGNRTTSIEITDSHPIVSFDRSVGKFISPRFRSSIDFCAKYIRIYGPRQTFDVYYKHITHVYLLPKPDLPIWQRPTTNVNFSSTSTDDYYDASDLLLDDNDDDKNKNGQVMDLLIFLHPKCPVRDDHRHKRNNDYLILELNRQQIEARINLDRDVIDELYGKKNISQVLRGEYVDVLCKVFHLLSDKQIELPDDLTRPPTLSSLPSRSSSSSSFITCTYRNRRGCFYAMEDRFIFLQKPTFCLFYKDIHKICFCHQESPLVNEEEEGEKNQNNSRPCHVPLPRWGTRWDNGSQRKLLSKIPKQKRQHPEKFFDLWIFLKPDKWYEYDCKFPDVVFHDICGADYYDDMFHSFKGKETTNSKSHRISPNSYPAVEGLPNHIVKRFYQNDEDKTNDYIERSKSNKSHNKKRSSSENRTENLCKKGKRKKKKQKK